MIEPGTKNGEILRGPPVQVLGVVVLDHRQPADAGTDHHTDLRAVLVRDLQAAVTQRLGARGQPVVDERIEMPGFLGGKVGLDREIPHLSGNLAGECAGIETGDPADAGLARHDVLPGGRDIVSDRGHDPQSGDHYTATAHGALLDAPAGQALLAPLT